MSQAPIILVVVQAEAPRTAAVDRAVELARLGGGTLHLCSFVHDPLLDVPDAYSASGAVNHARRVVLGDQLAALRALSTECACAVPRVYHEAVVAPVPHEAILAKAMAIGAEYVIKDLGPSSLISRILFTPLDWKLVRMLPCALMLVRPGSPASPRRILAAIDIIAEGAEAEGLNDQIVRAARELAGYSGARLDLVSVAPGMKSDSGMPLAAGVVLDRVLAAHAAAFDILSSRYDIAPDCLHQLVGPPAERIAALARSVEADLVAVGNIYRNPLERLLLGSTAEILLQDLECDLLVVKRHDFVDVLARHLSLQRIARELCLGRADPPQRELA